MSRTPSHGETQSLLDEALARIAVLEEEATLLRGALQWFAVEDRPCRGGIPVCDGIRMYCGKPATRVVKTRNDQRNVCDSDVCANGCPVETELLHADALRLLREPTDFKRVTVDGVEYVVTRRYVVGWMRRYTAFAMMTDSACYADGGLFGDGKAYAALPTVPYKPRETFDARSRAAWELSVRVILEAFPDEIDRRNIPRVGKSVEFERMPDAVATVMESHGIPRTLSMKQAATVFARAVASYRTVDLRVQRLRLLAHALKAGNVPAQEKWARCVVATETL